MMRCSPGAPPEGACDQHARRERPTSDEGVTVAGRHAAAQPPRTPRGRRVTGQPSSTPRHPSSVVAGAIVTVMAGALCVLTVVALSFAGISVLPRSEAAPAPSPSPTPSLSRVALVSTPAQQVIQTTLTADIGPGWRAASDLSWTGGTPFDSSCGRPAVDAALAATRVFDIPGRQVVVTVSAYTAGAGAVALKGWNDVIAACSGAVVSASATATPGAEALVAGLAAADSRPAAAVLFWRRGDVVASVTTVGTSPTGLAEGAARVDGALLAPMSGRCVNISSALADAGRSPWVATGFQGGAFTGLTTAVPVHVTPLPLPTAPAGVAGVPSTYVPTPVPSVSFPVRPADPVYPADLPTPMATPETPVRPSPAPSVTTYPSRLDDTVGPGCGWAFTGQVKPPFNEGQEAVLAQTRAQQALADLALRQQDWQTATLDYWEAVPLYQQQVQAFAAYASAVQQVALAWDTISAQRAAYDAALAAYNTAVEARTQFFLDLASAQAAYDAATAACQTLPTDSASPSDTASPSSSPSASPTSTDGCPPVIPPILLETPPAVPLPPTTPPDPRPTG